MVLESPEDDDMEEGNSIYCAAFRATNIHHMGLLMCSAPAGSKRSRPGNNELGNPGKKARIDSQQDEGA